MINANSGRHAHSRKVTLDATASNAIQKAIDARKVAAFTIGAAGVLAGAAFAFGATPAMAAETAATTPATPATVTASTGSAATSAASSTASADTGTATDNQDANKNTENVSKTAEKKAENAKPAEKKDGNSATTDTDKTNAASSATEETTAKKRVGRSLDPDTPVPVDQDRASNGDIKEVAFSSQTGEMPNVYGFGTVDNQYDEQLANNPITFKLPKQKDDNGADKAVTRVTVFPSPSNHINTKKTAGSIDFDSDNNGHQPYSGEYVFNKNNDGSATLTMNRIFRKDERGDSKGIKNAQGYSATRSIQINPTPVLGSAKEDAVSDQFRAALLVPPKSAGTIVKKVSDTAITENDVNNAMDDAKKTGKTTHVDKSGIDGLSLEAQIQALSKVGKRKLDTIAEKIPTSSNEYDKNALTKANSKVGVSIVDTHFVTDLGFKSQAIPLTIVRYNDVIDKPIVEDPNNLSQDVKNEIANKLAKINGVTPDKITFDEGNAVIHFDGVDAKDAPKIKLSDLVLKKLNDTEYKIPSDSDTSTVKAVVVANPLGYSNAELKQIKKAIYEANKDNQEFGLSEKDYDKQISLGWLTGDLTQTGDANKGISNGQSENTITVTIKTDKAYAQFKSDIKKHQLTRLIDLRKDYKLSWDANNNKIKDRNTDEGLAWMENGKTLVYRYDPDKGVAFNTKDVLELLKATVNADVAKANPQLRKELLGTEYQGVTYEGKKNAPTRSHVGYIVDANGEPIGVLNLTKLNGSSYGGFAKPVDNSNEKMGDEQSSVNKYTFDDASQAVEVAGKNGKCMIGRLFIEPYTQYQYNYIYGEGKYNPRTSPKGINVVFVPQTNHKTSNLKDSINEHKTKNVDGKDVPTQSAYYNASDAKKNAYDDALKVAQQTLQKVGSTADADLTEALKAEVDNATIALNKARAELDGDKTDKTKLEQDIKDQGNPKKDNTAASGTYETDKYKNVTEPDFKDANGNADTKKNDDAKAAKKAYDDALTEANKVKADDNATQKAVDEAKAKLDAARKELDKYSTNKDKLNAAIAEHGKVKDGRDAHGTQTLANADPAYQNATEKERKAYDAAVKKANDLSADPNASQKEVNEAITALENAKKALDAEATDKSKLITAEKLSFDNPDKDDANRQSTFYKNALNKQTNGANDQEKQAAKTAVENYDNALKKARDVIADKNATQEQVNAAKEALTNAEKVLHEKYATDANELTKVLADNFSGYLMPAYFNAFDKAHAGDADAKKAFKDYNDAYQKAKVLKQNFEATDPSKQPTATDIADAKTALEEARKVIDKYATNTSRLSAAVFNDIAIQHSPAYKNVSADDASADAKAAKQKYDDAVTKLHQALDKKIPKDKQGDTEIPTSNPPDANIDVTNADALKNIQAHANGEPLDRDITSILKEMNDAAAELNKFATKTDKLLESINKDTDTQKDPAYKNTKDPAYKKTDDPTADNTDKNNAAKKAKSDYDSALDAAKKVMLNPSATQKEVNEALNNLNEKRTALDAYKTDTTKLAESVKKHGNTDGAAPTEGTQTSDAYRNASDPHFLKLDNGKLVPDDTKNNAAAAAKKAYDKALAEAQELLKKADTKNNNTPLDAQPTQKQIDAALKKLDDARTEVEKYKTVTTDLETEANKSTPEHADVTEDDFEDTPEFKNADAKKKDGADGKKVDNDDVKAYKDALAKARKLAQDNTSKTLSDHPTQKQVDDALEALKKAKQNIVDGYKTDVDKLKQAKQYAEDVFKKTPEYKNATAIKDDANNAKHEQAGKDLGDATKQTGFEGQITKIAEKLKDTSKLTQREVDALVKQLNIAQKKIADSYKTNVDKLNNEVGDKNQDGKPVTPKFEESIPYKNVLAKADAGDNDATAKLKDYNDKLKAAQKIIDQVNNPDPNAKPEDRPTQKQVDDALKALQDAKKAIDDSFGTKIDDLKTEAAKSTADGATTVGKDDFEATTEFKNADSKKTGDDKDNADVTAYKEALKKARTLLGKFDENGKPKPGEKDIPSQKEVDKALKELQDAKKKITDVYKTDPSKLKSEADADGDFTKTPEYQNAQAKGDDASKQALDTYKKALEDANKVLGDKNATQAQVDEALKKLQDAKSKLSDGYKTNKSDLTAEAGKDSDFTKTPEFQNAVGSPEVEAYKKALEDAKKVLGDKNATQAQVDEALKKLQDAKQKLADSHKTDKTALQTESNADGDFTKTPEYQNAQAKGDDASKQALDTYKKALEDANSVLKDPNATQKQVDDALKKLQEAKKNLADSHKTDKTKLQTESNADGDFTKTPEFQNAAGSPEVDAYKKALEDAKKVLGDKNATQAQVDEALKKLQDAKSKLADSHKTDKTGLTAEAGKDSDFTKTPEFQNAAGSPEVEAYKKALEDAKKVLGDKNATQAQVDEALKKLQDAKKKLSDSHKTDKTKLQTESNADGAFTKTPEFQNAAGSPEVDAYKKALDEANSVLKDPNATQAQVDEALKKLQDAKKNLADSHKTDTSKLKSEADADSDFRKKAAYLVGEAPDLDAYKKALDEANSVLKNPNATQKQVDDALKKLQDAKQLILNKYNSIGTDAGSGASGTVQNTSTDTTGSVNTGNTGTTKAEDATNHAVQADSHSANADANTAKNTAKNTSNSTGKIVKTGAKTSIFAELAAVFAGLGAAVIARRRKHSRD